MHAHTTHTTVRNSLGLIPTANTIAFDLCNPDLRLFHRYVKAGMN